MEVISKKVNISIATVKRSIKRLVELMKKHGI
ncbi:winged helix-turn-helix transcriptional regulator [Clostridium sporogenes]